MTGLTSLIPLLILLAFWVAVTVMLIRFLKKKLKKWGLDKKRYDLAMSFASSKFSEDLRRGESVKEDETDLLLKYFEYAYGRYSNLKD